MGAIRKLHVFKFKLPYIILYLLFQRKSLKTIRSGIQNQLTLFIDCVPMLSNFYLKIKMHWFGLSYFSLYNPYESLYFFYRCIFLQV